MKKKDLSLLALTVSAKWFNQFKKIPFSHVNYLLEGNGNKESREFFLRTLLAEFMEEFTKPDQTSKS